MLPILFEDNYLLVINKPADLQAEKDRWGNPSAEAQVSAYLKKNYPWKKQLITGVVHRLDRQVSGAMAFALTPMALKNLGSQLENRTMQKIYVALVEGTMPEMEGSLTHWLKKDLENRRAVVGKTGQKTSKECRLLYRVLEKSAGKSLLEVELLTGRYHQIRAQLAAAGCPIEGDEKYGSLHPYRGQIALHARKLKLVHPKTAEKLEITAPLPVNELWKPWINFI